MSKKTITRSCGHTETVNISGPYKGRERQAEYEATKQCKACWQAEQEAKRAAANTAAADAAQAAGRPELQGTEKQVAWATTIREAKCGELQALAANVIAQQGDGIRSQVTSAAVARIEAETSAAWWIEHRNETPIALIKAAITADEMARLQTA